MTLSCSNGVNVPLRKNQDVYEINKKKLSILTEMDKGGEFHLQLYSSSPAPKRDYHGLTISGSEIILNSWDISRGTHVYPRRKRMSLNDFLLDKWLRSEIEFLFGKHVIEYIDRIARKDRSIFCLSEKLVRKIIDYLAVNDVLSLKQTSKIFFELCNTNEIWKILFRKIQKRPPSAAELKQAELGLTWCHILQTRVHDIHERKTIFQNYKKGVEALHRQNHEIGDKIRNTVKKQTKDKWKRPPPDTIKEKLLENKIKIPTYNESASVSRSETKKPTIKLINSTSQPINKKRIESKKSIETINEIKKVSFSQTPKTATTKKTTLKSAKPTTSTSTKTGKNNDNLKSKTFIA